MIHHLLSGLHDMTKHVLPFHLVPRSRLLELGERAVAAMGFVKRRLARELGWARIQGFAPKEWLAPVPLLSFYENDLVDYCHGVWNAIERPEDFEPTFVRSRHYAQLVDVLASRARQAKGLGAPWSRVWPRPYLRFEIDGPTRLEPRPRAGR